MDTNDPTVTAGLLEAARASHAAAVQRHDDAANRAGRAAENHRVVAGQRAEMLRRAATGESVTTDDLRRSTVAEADAKDFSDLHANLRDGAARVRDELHISLMRTEASHFAARVSAAQRAYVQAARDADEAVDAARQKIADADSAGDVLRTLAAESAQHAAHTLPTALQTNVVLREMHTSQHPRLAAVAVPNKDFHLELVHHRDGHAENRTVVHSLARLAAGIAPAASPAPAPEPAPAVVPTRSISRAA